MTYDAWQRLVKVKSGSTILAVYAYDGQNRRTTKTIGTTTRHYYYSSQWQILEERLNTATTADRQFVWGLMALDNLVLRDRGSERFYSLQDVFSCTAIVDTSGTVQERYGYNAFGLSRVMDANFNVISTSSYDWETRYACYRFDAESSFYQVRFRYLHPTLGRWITRDPIEYDGGINLYAYVGNKPLNKTDFFGLISDCSPTGHNIERAEHNNYLIFEITCPKGCQAQNITIDYNVSAIEHQMYDDEYPHHPRHYSFTSYVTDLEGALAIHGGNSSIGGPTPRNNPPKTNCAGNPVRVEAYMRSRLVDGFDRGLWEIAMESIGPLVVVPSTDTMLDLYEKYTCVKFDCVKCS